jgi:hypothetical protein
VARAIADAAAQAELAAAARIEEALPPFLADRDGFLVAARGGTLIELNIAEQPA